MSDRLIVKIKKIGLFFLMSYFVLACKEEAKVKGNKLSFGYTSCYLLGTNELYEPIIDSSLLDKYRVFYNLENIQMPVNRVVARTKDTLFIALTTEPKINRVKQAHNAVKTHEIISKDFTDSTLSYFIAKDGYYNYRYVYQNKSSQLVFLFNYISTDSLHIYDLYSKKGYIEKCIKCEF